MFSLMLQFIHMLSKMPGCSHITEDNKSWFTLINKGQNTINLSLYATNLQEIKLFTWHLFAQNGTQIYAFHSKKLHIFLRIHIWKPWHLSCVWHLSSFFGIFLKFQTLELSTGRHAPSTSQAYVRLYEYCSNHITLYVDTSQKWLLHENRFKHIHV